MRGKKMAAPIVITALLVLILTGYLCVFVTMPLSVAAKGIFLLIILAFTGAAVYNLIVRIKEIRSGEEDDLSKY